MDDGSLAYLYSSGEGASTSSGYLGILGATGLATSAELPLTDMGGFVAQNLERILTNSLIISGYVADDNQSYTLIARTNQAGELAWKYAYRTPEPNRPVAMTTDTEGNTYVVGNIGVDTEPDVFLLKVNNFGQRKWARRIIDGADSDEARAIVYANGYIYLVVQSLSFETGTESHTFLVRASADGGIIDRVLPLVEASGADFTYLSTANRGEFLILTGSATNADQTNPLALLIHCSDFSTSTVFTDSTRQGEFVSAAERDGSFYFAGNYLGTGAFVSLYDDAGKPVNSREFASGGALSARYMQLAPDGQPIVMCQQISNFGVDIAIIALSRA